MRASSLRLQASSLTLAACSLKQMDQDKQKKWYHNLWFIIVMLLTIGPFAFPLLWKSPNISRSLKWILTILFVILTIAAIWLSIETGKAVWKEVESLRGVLY